MARTISMISGKSPFDARRLTEIYSVLLVFYSGELRHVESKLVEQMWRLFNFGRKGVQQVLHL
jgi:hypothetical protein